MAPALKPVYPQEIEFSAFLWYTFGRYDCSFSSKVLKEGWDFAERVHSSLKKDFRILATH